MTGKQRIRDILKRLFKDGTIDDVAGNAEKWEQISVDQALDSIEEVVKEVLGEKQNEYAVPPRRYGETGEALVDGLPDRTAIQNNKLRSEQLKRWSDK